MAKIKITVLESIIIHKIYFSIMLVIGLYLFYNKYKNYNNFEIFDILFVMGLLILMYRIFSQSLISWYLSILLFITIYLSYLIGIINVLLFVVNDTGLEVKDYLEMIFTLLFITLFLWLTIRFKPKEVIVK